MGPIAAHLLIARGDAQWSLVAQDSDDVVPLRALPCQIGRHPGVPVRVIHPTVSLVHAELRGCAAGLELTARTLRRTHPVGSPAISVHARWRFRPARSRSTMRRR